jgi:uncharacterized membrane protein
MVHPGWFASLFPLAAHAHWGWGPGPWIGVVVLTWAAITLAVIWLIRQTGARRDSESRGSPTAAEILDRRFAEGAISAEVYRERRETLRQPDR